MAAISPMPPAPRRSPPSAWSAGFLILTCGVYADTVRLLTPLTASEMVLNEGLDILESAILGN